jgi:hypothetical protein
MYTIINILSALVRQFVLPNPYKNIFDDIFIAMLFNILAGGTILHLISFSMVGIFYKRGECPAVGSAMYLLCYIVNTIIVTIAGILTNNLHTLVIVLLFLYLIIYIVLIVIKNKTTDTITRF